MKKHISILFFILLPSAFILPALSAAERPNIIIMVSDDMGWTDVGYHGGRIKTSNIDKLAETGVQFDRFYVHPVCSPTRTALMTGRSPARFGIIHALGGSNGVPADEHFMPQTFKSAGYQTFMVGKWHLGAADEAHAPRKRGYDHFYGFRGGVIDYYTHMTDKDGLDWQRNGETLEEEGYSTDLFAAEAVSLLKNRDKRKPVFMVICFNAPHGPAQAPEELIKKYGNMGNKGVRAASIEAMDNGIGKVLATLDAEKMAENTIVLFFCDNGGGDSSRGGKAGSKKGKKGGATASTQGGTQLILTGGKGSISEGGIRVPAVLRWPAQIKAGSISEQLFSDQDLLPTLAAAAGITPGNTKALDGVNVWDAIATNKVVSRRPVVVAGVEAGDFAVLHDQWKLLQTKEGGLRLFDVFADPGESKDVAGDNPKIVAHLKAFLEPIASLNVQLPKKGGKKGSKKEGKSKSSTSTSSTATGKQHVASSDNKFPKPQQPEQHGSGFTVITPVLTTDRALPSEYTGDGCGVSMPVQWSGAPVGTKSFALSLWHVAPDKEKSYWVLYNIPANVRELPADTKGIGLLGYNDDNSPEYKPMKSKGGGIKEYKIRVKQVLTFQVPYAFYLPNCKNP